MFKDHRWKECSPLNGLYCIELASYKFKEDDVRNLVNREKCKACKVIIVVLLCKIPSCVIVDNVYQVPGWELYYVWYRKLHCLLRFFFPRPCGAQSNSA
jgi:hypothetical protein